MGWLKNSIAGARSLAQKRRVNAEIDEELDEFFIASTEFKQQIGMTPEEARRAAIVEMGSRNVIKHKLWTSRWEGTMDGFLQDVRVSLRMLARSKGFTAVALISLAVGIGGNTAMFTLIDQVLLRPLPVRAPQQLVSFGKALGGGFLGGIDIGLYDMYNYEFARQLQMNPGPFAGVASYDSGLRSVSVREAGVDASSPATQFTTSLVSGNYFSVLEADARWGRTIMPTDETAPGANPVVVVSHEFWQQAMSSDPSAVGKSLSINGTPFAVVGVMPEGFQGFTQAVKQPDLWVPLTMQAQITLEAAYLGPRGPYFMHLFAREKPGTNRVQEQQWVDKQIHDYVRAGEGGNIPVARQQEIDRETDPLIPAANGVSILQMQYGDSLKLLQGVVAVVLLIACANLANFVLARTTTRQREIATRLALGSSRGRIVRQGLIETFLLSITGGVLGLGLAFVVTRALIAFVTSGSDSTALSARPNGSVLLFTVGVSLVTGLLFGLAPALSAAKLGAAGNLTSNSRQGGDGGSRLWPKALVSAQVIMSLLLLVSAGLLLRTLDNLQKQNYGFERTHLLLAEFDAKLAGYKASGTAALHQRMLDRLSAIPGVQSVALSATPPISRGAWHSTLNVPGYVAQPKEDMSSSLNRVTGQYFETVGIPMAAGRPINPDDSATGLKVAVINEALAKHFFPKGNAVGSSLSINISTVSGPWRIVGVARDTKAGGPRAETQRMVYLPIVQIAATTPGESGPEDNNDRFAGTIELRTANDPAMTVKTLRQAMTEVDSNIPLREVHTIEEVVDGMVTNEALTSQLAAMFSLLAVGLAGIGLYGVMSYNVVRRTSEIGIRLALGARTRTVQWMVLRESLELLAIGIGLGLPLTLAATMVLRKQLFGLTATDPVTFLVAIGVVTGMTLFAAWWPARRATRIDPMVALRAE